MPGTALHAVDSGTIGSLLMPCLKTGRFSNDNYNHYDITKRGIGCRCPLTFVQGENVAILWNKVPFFPAINLSTGRIRITLRLNFSNVNISASIHPAPLLNKSHHWNPHKITFRTGGQVPSKHYTNQNNHIFTHRLAKDSKFHIQKIWNISWTLPNKSMGVEYSLYSSAFVYKISFEYGE
jgi:hypothetical protein